MHSDEFTNKKWYQDERTGYNIYPLESYKGAPATSQTNSATAH